PRGWDAAREPAPLAHAVAHANPALVTARDSPHRLRERVAEALHHLIQRQVGICGSTSQEVRRSTRVAREHALEVIEEFGNSLRDEMPCATLCFASLVLVIEAAGDRVV